jgi:hypothetical protein
MDGHSEVESFREFAREIILRMDQSLRDFAVRLEAVHEDVRASREESRRYFETLDARLREEREEHRHQREEQRAESRAQTQALLRMLDRLDGGASAVD